VAPIAWSDVVALPNLLGVNPPNFAGVSMTAQTAILNMVNAELDVDAFDGEDGPDTHLARVYMAAHFACVGPLAAVLTGEREDDLATTYALVPVPTSRDASMAFWFRTGYGAAYWNMVQTSFAGLPFVV
jgi:hypothetical protein